MSKRLSSGFGLAVLAVFQACDGAEPTPQAADEAIQQVYQGSLTVPQAQLSCRCQLEVVRVGGTVFHFGLDLTQCAVTGATEDLAYVSPKTGRAVSEAAAGPYKEKLIELPAFLSTGGLPSDDDQLRKGLDLTGYFLERHVFWPHNKPLPPARARFMETLQR